MKLYLYKFFSHLTIVLSVVAFIGCSNQENNSESIRHSHDHEHGHEHSEHSSNITSLTPQQIKAINIVLGDLQEKALTSTIKANGILKVPNNYKANVSSHYGGLVNDIRVQIGEQVHKGQLIATITNPDFIQLQEEYLSLSSKIVFAKQEQQRQQELNDGNAGSLKNLQNATAELNTLNTRKASLAKQIQLMGIELNTLTASNLSSTISIKSPISGTVGNIFARIGSYVDVTFPVAEVVDNGSIHLDLQVFEKDLPLVKVGQLIHFTVTNNPVNQFDAKVFSVNSSFENQSKTIAVHANVVGDKTGLIDGMNITGVIGVNDVKQQAVPDEAIVNAEGKFYVFIQTDKSADDLENHEHEHEHEHDSREGQGVNFEKIEVIKGVSDMGYTAVSFVKDVPKDVKVVVKGAYFINAKMTNTGEHHH